MKKIAILALLVVSYAFVGLPQQSELQEKFLKAIRGTYEIDAFSLDEIRVSEKNAAAVFVEMNNENLFAIKQADQLIGYAYLGTAPSKKRTFEYVVLFDADFVIKKSKVLIYRENYGLQIGTQRWLKQFIGMTPESTVRYGENVAAISGATISATSMANAVNDVLRSIRILQEKSVL